MIECSIDYHSTMSCILSFTHSTLNMCYSVYY